MFYEYAVCRMMWRSKITTRRLFWVINAEQGLPFPVGCVGASKNSTLNKAPPKLLQPPFFKLLFKSKFITIKQSALHTWWYIDLPQGCTLVATLHNHSAQVENPLTTVWYHIKRLLFYWSFSLQKWLWKESRRFVNTRGFSSILNLANF